MPAVVLVLGVASLTMLVGINRIHEQMIRRDQARVSAIEEIQLGLTIAHLWLEEHLTGDQVDLQEISDNTARARGLIGALLEEQAEPNAGSEIRSLKDDPLRSIAIRLQARIEEFHSLQEWRLQGFDREEDVGIGSDLDVAYDAVYRGLLSDARSLDAVLTERQIRNRSRARLLFRSIVTAWTFIIALAVVGLWTHERRRIKVEADLRSSQAQLLQAQKMDAVGRLAGGMAHDINNYLAAIRAQSELVKGKSDPASGVGAKMDSIMRVVSKASSLIERLLAFSRQQPIQPVVIDLNRVIEENVGTLVGRLIGEDVRLETRLDPELWNVRIDPSQIEQVLVNLVVNAREAMPTGGAVTIVTRNHTFDAASARARGLAGPADYLSMSVSDTGAGIPTEIVGHIFDPFFSTKERSRASGLGLTTVYGIVEQAGGVISVDSRPGEGTTFEILLPRSKKQPDADPEAPPVVVEPLGDSATILLVEDNDDLREATTSMIEALGYQVVSASNGEEALARFEDLDEHVDLVITDVVMPGLNGKELADRIRARRKDIRVLFVSGYTDDVILKHGISEGSVTFLKKPFSAEGLVGKIRGLLQAPRCSTVD